MSGDRALREALILLANIPLSCAHKQRGDDWNIDYGDLRVWLKERDELLADFEMGPTYPLSGGNLGSASSKGSRTPWPMLAGPGDTGSTPVADTIRSLVNEAEILHSIAGNIQSATIAGAVHEVANRLEALSDTLERAK